MMKTTIERLADDKVRLDIEVPTDVLQYALEHTLEDLGRDMRVPGFRPGKVPAQAVLARIGREAAMQEAVRHFLSDWYVSAVAASGIRPIADPEIDLGEGATSADSPLNFSVTVNVAPKPKLPELKGLEVDRPKLPDLGKYVDQVMESTLRAAGVLEPTGKPAEEGDEVVVDFECRVEGELVRGAAATGYEAKIGDGRLLEELEKAIVGQSAGSEVTVPVTFQDDHPMTDLAGNDAVFSLTVREVQHLNVPTLTDDVTKQVSEFSTAKELTASIEADIRERISGEIDGIFRGNAVSKLAEVAELNEPAVLVERKQQEAYGNFKQQLAQYGLNIETYMAQMGQSQEDFLTDLEKQARDEVRRELSLVALAEDANIDVTEADLIKEITEHAESTGLDVDETVTRLRRTGQADMLRGELLIQRTIDYLVDSVKAVEVDPPDPEEEAAAAAAAEETAGDAESV